MENFTQTQDGYVLTDSIDSISYEANGYNTNYIVSVYIGKFRYVISTPKELRDARIQLNNLKKQVEGEWQRKWIEIDNGFLRADVIRGLEIQLTTYNVKYYIALYTKYKKYTTSKIHDNREDAETELNEIFSFYQL